MRDRPEPSSAPSRASSKEIGARQGLPALQELDQIGIREVLDQDTRATFVIDLSENSRLAHGSTELSPVFGNAPLRRDKQLWDAVRGIKHHEEVSTVSYEEFSSWVAGCVKPQRLGIGSASTY